MRKIIVLYSLFILFSLYGFSQAGRMDSLKAALANAKEDTTRLRIYVALGEACPKNENLTYAEPIFQLTDKLLAGKMDRKRRDKVLSQQAFAYDMVAIFYSTGPHTDWSKAISYSESRLKKIEQGGDKRRIAETMRLIADMQFMQNDTAGYIKSAENSLSLMKEVGDSAAITAQYIGLCNYHLSTGNFSKAIEAIRSAIQVCGDLNYKEGLAISLTRLADIYRDNGEDAQAMENYRRALDVLKDTKDSSTLFNVIAAQAGFYFKQKNIGEALANYYKLVQLCEASKDLDRNVGSAYKWIGIVYKENGDAGKALLNFEKSLHAFDSAKQKEQVKYIYDEIGSVYYNEHQLEKAIEYHKMAVSSADSLNWEVGRAQSLYLLSLDYFAQKKYPDAKKCNEQGLTIFKKQFDLKPLSEVELLASRVDSATGNGMGAYAHYKEYSQLVNRLKGEEINKAAQSEKFQKEFERQKTEQDKRNEEAKRIKNQQLFTIIVLALVLLTILIIAFLLWKNNTQKQKANLLLRSQKEKIETTLSELKATQAQLIQSEKMASLGQLTAGIAHEIQNPLNFVNNFSDINKEIITEMSEALKQGNYEEASLIASDIRENEIKINQHGKRADAIIKGMLQHSRSGAGQKEPTDINALADEYLRLSYHGFLARNPSFNAILKTRFDGNIGKTNIIPQDMGKVLLNIYNNSFYAVSEKINQHIAGYEPTVIVNTKKAGDKIEITITDNGTGIPPNLVDKIFQPFFTTKPTGQGTGLGLSLAYDITKAHGGDLKAASVAGEGSDFMIILPA